VLLAYLDESYDENRYWITGLLCPEDTLIPLTQALDTVVSGFEFAPPAPRLELHGYELFHGEDQWKFLKKEPRRRIKVYGDALDAVAKFPDVRIFIRGIDRKRQKARYSTVIHPHKVVLGHLLERLDEHAEHHGDHRLLVIADEIHDAATHRSSLWDYQHSGTEGYRPRVLTQVVDTMHFAPSHASRLLQASDLISYLHHRMSSGADTDQRALKANAGLWARVQPQVQHRFCWCP
jgi:uncharacterized protein DUF3800